MKALRCAAGAVDLVHDYPDPHGPPGEALLRVRMAGVCNTDLEVLRGYASFEGILGHEFVATVKSCDDTSWVGRRVVGEINVSCGRCELCCRGLPTHCLDRAAVGIHGRDGAFAEFLTLPLQNLHLVPDEVPDAQAVFVEPLAAALEILEQVLMQ